MKKYILFFTFIILSFALPLNAQINYKVGENLKFRVHYSGLNAGYASIDVKEATLNGKSHFHIVGKGTSTGAVRAFFKVDDNYESYIDKTDLKPTKFVRNIVEGSYKRHQIYYFDHANRKAKVENKRDGKVTTETIPYDAQDLLSAFYSLRNTNHATLKTGDYLNENIFLGDETLKFRLKVLGRETLKTKFGKIAAIKIRPYVQSGRVFKESESVTMWISDDDNLVPLKIKAGLLVGSLNADLNEYSNLKYPITFTK
ncbi:DUF3108 domain-containing protein [Empedobacter sp. GD03797]|uniref:DUF3108 domain-containing protein n=1 Tax=Empedobacter sp. GD03797 TaxID=2975382 RepID=UPI00244CCC79|nr:DUF3108 domain-containing protein [Empedobacter sp. GD03797]MDH1883471.1 DUF3108 domain-containing protein [Empedobacter sp. GD03797]